MSNINSRVLKSWEVTTYVVQWVGEAGQWYDEAILNMHPSKMKSIDTDLYNMVDKLTPKTRNWRIIRRVSHEIIEDSNYID